MPERFSDPFSLRGKACKYLDEIRDRLGTAVLVKSKQEGNLAKGKRDVAGEALRYDSICEELTIGCASRKACSSGGFPTYLSDLRWPKVETWSPRRGEKWRRTRKNLAKDRRAASRRGAARQLIISQINRTTLFCHIAMTKHRACLSVVCTETRCVSRANNVAGTECGCLFFFGAFLIRIAPSCAKKDFWSSPKRSWIKISRETVFASKSSRDFASFPSSFFPHFFFL